MRKFLFSLIFAFIFLFVPQVSSAEVIHYFDTNITAHKNGTMDIAETINYDFQGAYRHGIYRYIPLFSKVGDLYRIIQINNVKILKDGNPEPFSILQDNEKITFKIGDPNKTSAGNHTYQIYYQVENGIGSNFSDHDEIYWNVTGNDWQVAIESIRAKVETDFSAKATNFICFQGQIGSTDKTCKVDESGQATSLSIYPGSGLTIVAVYPVNTFPKSVLSKTLPQTASQEVFGSLFKYYYLIFIVLNFGLGGYLLFWYKKYKSKKSLGPPAVNFDIPKDEKGNRIAPALAGTIDTAKLERDDVTATIFDLAIRKYIKLEQTKLVRSLLPDSTEQTITKLKNEGGELEAFEKTLFQRLFRDGDSVEISDLKLDFYETFQDMEKDVFAELVVKKYYTKNPKGQKTGLIFLSVISFITLNIILGIIFLFLSQKLNGRTTLGDELDFKIDGLKLFLKSMDRNYNWQAEKFYTVEQMIPYAMALGFIDKFMEALKILKPDYNPSWYSGGNFYVNYAIFSAASSANLITSAPSSSSGAGGGGFSGGGGGGGGGGSW
jgi:uncharacterized membrane protein